MNCINLQNTFGAMYRVTIDGESAEGRRDHSPWLQQLRCRRGLIYPYSETHLAVQVDHHPVVAERLVRLGFKLIQDGDDEKTFLFTPDRFDEVAAIVRPFIRRHLSEEQRRHATERFAAHRANARSSPAAQSAIQARQLESAVIGLKYGFQTRPDVGVLP